MSALCVDSEAGGSTTVSRLVIPKAAKGDSGVYSCSLSRHSSVLVHVHILNGEVFRAINVERSVGNIQLYRLHGCFFLSSARRLLRCISYTWSFGKFVSFCFGYILQAMIHYAGKLLNK